MNGIYRQKAIKNTYNPEQFGQAVTITSPLAKLGIIGIALLFGAFIIWAFFGRIPTVKTTKGVYTDKTDIIAVNSEYSGTIEKYNVKIGEPIKKGQIAATVKNSYGVNKQIKSEYSGIVTYIPFKNGGVVYSSDEIMRIAPDNIKENCVVCYIPISDAMKLKTNAQAVLYPNLDYSDSNGHLDAEVKYISKYPADERNTSLILGNGSGLRNLFPKNSAVTEVVLEIKNKLTKDGYITNSNKLLKPQNKSAFSVKIITENTPPVKKFFSFLKNGGGSNG